MLTGKHKRKKQMKKTLLLLVISLSLVLVGFSAVVKAQSEETLDTTDTTTLDSTSDTTNTDTTTADTTSTESAGVPDTGFAPKQNKLVASSLVFIGGAAIGGLVGFGIHNYRKKSSL
jgi:hypothetical protein